VKFYHYLKLLVFIFVGCFAAHAELPKKLKVSVYQIEGLLEFKKQQLPFNQILNMVDQRISTKFDYQFYYPLRAVEVFDDNEADCMFPGSVLVYDLKSPPLESIPLQTAEAYFIALENINTANLLDVSQPALNIGYRRGNTYGGNITKLAHHNLMPLNSGANVRELIARKRIDVFLGYLPDSLALIHEVPNQPLVYTQESLFYRQNDSFLCHDTAEIRPFLAQMNLVIQKMHDSGEISKILEVLNSNATK
jgi:hypothetical protein